MGDRLENTTFGYLRPLKQKDERRLELGGPTVGEEIDAMSDGPEDITLRYLRRVDEKIDGLADSVRELTLEVRAMRAQMTVNTLNDLAQDSAITSLKDRVSRIERRLDLVD